MDNSRKDRRRISQSPGGLRSLVAVTGRKLNTGFTAPTERTPSSSRGSASNGPSVRGNDVRWGLGDAMGVVRLLTEQQPDI
jgi:hypothetical protein